jgi:hypothetical protein
MQFILFDLTSGLPQALVNPMFPDMYVDGGIYGETIAIAVSESSNVTPDDFDTLLWNGAAVVSRGTAPHAGAIWLEELLSWETLSETLSRLKASKILLFKLQVYDLQRSPILSTSSDSYSSSVHWYCTDTFRANYSNPACFGMDGQGGVVVEVVEGFQFMGIGWWEYQTLTADIAARDSLLNTQLNNAIVSLNAFSNPQDIIDYNPTFTTS